ncbi:hypothetical protein BASA50_007480 [Batrachochytrium salamandrivorans]|uniref:Chitinase n=1 Tax=Batrachochytrium salamandrivorans TaxID=1357716 RepID=A0ABQ8F6V2_9FUNG|nr:hypothetical protein BASA62_008625 [Batrachochytrium salamandrivorans]KAH6574270.1 hypothetical protein BASA60_005621 [Batrachochytrium salamandrivorans]KAH6583100.1 hypothetical protein BASA61_008148 [Batrachochytrium salamandrivorans]KAH6593273.1 hypothetical protein BASA50_007480 [Batrachochytrium salamandrivorans]KAH9274177.1 hypothetical protein BASA83_003483 [Batrachochytrium salamandrivorans]
MLKPVQVSAFIYTLASFVCAANNTHLIVIKQGNTCLELNGIPTVNTPLRAGSFCGVFSIRTGANPTTIIDSVSGKCLSVSYSTGNTKTTSLSLDACDNSSGQVWGTDSLGHISAVGTNDCLAFNADNTLIMNACSKESSNPGSFVQYGPLHTPRTLQIQHAKFPYICAGGDTVSRSTVRIHPICANFEMHSFGRLRNINSDQCLDVMNGIVRLQTCSNSQGQKWAMSAINRTIKSLETKTCLDINYLHNTLVLAECKNVVIRYAAENSIGKRPSTRFSPYTDVSQDNIELGATVRAAKLRHITFAFIIAHENGNSITWGGEYVLGGPDDAIDKKVIQSRENGAQITASFGGADGKELALAIVSVEKLHKAYQKVIDYYGISMLDFDIEGSTLGDTAVNARRFSAISKLRKTNTNLEIFYTLPVETTGLGQEALDFISNGMKLGVRPDIVNIMTMDYDQNQVNMGAAAISASKNTYSQLVALGLTSTIGITPMIGVNDENGIFTPANAAAVLAFAKSTPYVTMLCFWALHRDNGSKTTIDLSSMIQQSNLQFSKLFSKFQPSYLSKTPL